jgi:hypothetical protein
MKIVIGIEIEDASKFIELSRLELTALPIADLVFSKGVPPSLRDYRVNAPTSRL